MDENMVWCVSFTFHDKDEQFMMGTIFVTAPELTQATDKACEDISKKADEEKWSDYWVIGVNNIPEYH